MANQPTTQSVQFPVAAQVFPAALKARDSSPDGETPGAFRVIGKKFSCQACENHFTCVELDPNDPKKKSKSWAVGYLMWGTEDPSMVECFMVKCPSCGQPAMVVPISKRAKASQLVKVGNAPLPQKAPPAQPTPKGSVIETNKPAKPTGQKAAPK